MADIERIFAPRLHDIGGLEVARVLPYRERRMVGPFIFLDHIGPATMPSGIAVDVRPHPHIGLSTLTFLFEGELFHRDNLGNALAILPGEVNWMTAGRGIAHSERTPERVRNTSHRLHGLQSWVALPTAHEEVAPEFFHYPSDAVPSISGDGLELRVIAGEAFGARAPVKTYSPLFYTEARANSGAQIELPDAYADKAVYVIAGTVEADGQTIAARQMAVFVPGRRISIRAQSQSHLLLLGGEPFPEPRLIWWNFVSSSQARLDRAKADWKAGRFVPIPGDDKEFIPLPE